MHKRFGKLPWARSVPGRDRVRRARLSGARRHRRGLAQRRVIRALKANEESARVFLPGGKPPQTGEVFRNPDAGRALRLIAEQGPDAFYKGEIAKAILKTSQHLGGTMTAEDLASFEPEWVQPLSIDYRGWRVYETAAERAGHGGARNAEYHGDQAADAAGRVQPHRDAQAHRGHEAGLLGRASLRRRSAHLRCAHRAASLETVCAQARGADRSEPRQLQGRERRPDRQQHHVPDRGGQGRQHRELDSEHLRRRSARG